MSGTNLFQEGPSLDDLPIAVAKHDVDSDQEGVYGHFALADEPIHDCRNRVTKLCGQQRLIAHDLTGEDERPLVCGPGAHGTIFSLSRGFYSWPLCAYLSVRPSAKYILSEYSYKLSRRPATYRRSHPLHTASVKVFLVEDAPLLRERLVALIASVGASTVGHAVGAREAIDGILAASPDAVVLDLHLKEGNGFDVLREVRKVAPAIAFFVLTNYPHEGYRAGAERLGARGFFDKSSEFDKLRDVLAAGLS